VSVLLVAFEREHLAQIKPQAAQLHEMDPVDSPVGLVWTALAGGRPVCCGGLQEIWAGRAYAYALLAADVGPHMLSLTRAIRFLLDAASFARIEMVVERDFAPGQRWAELLGFELETPTPLRKFLPSGRDAWIYARFRNGMGTVRSGGDAVRGRGVRQRLERPGCAGVEDAGVSDG
jgi:hypothetical protein